MAGGIGNLLDRYDQLDKIYQQDRKRYQQDRNQRDNICQLDSLNKWARQHVNILLDHMPGQSIDPDIETQQDMGHMIANLQVNILHLDMTFLMSHHNFLQ